MKKEISSYYELTLKEHGYYDWSFNRDNIIRYNDVSKLYESIKFLEKYKGTNYYIKDYDDDDFVKMFNIDIEVTDIDIPYDVYSCVDYKTVIYESVNENDLMIKLRKNKIENITEKIKMNYEKEI
jgi:hypothetical protein